jgi:ribonuclease HII
VTRDRVMQALAGRHPNYRWDRNVGYATLAHLQGLADHGVTRHHRRSFIPVQQLTLDLTVSDETRIDLAQLTALLKEGEEGTDVDSHFAGD